jgi:outer membrane protein TolC
MRTVLFGVAKAYYEVLKQKKIVALDKDTLGLAQGQLELSQNQYDAGTVSRVDVLRAQSTLESARQTLISDTNILALDRDTLANTLNLPQDARDFEAAQPADADEKIAVPFSQHLAEAYANREDYKVSAIAIKQSVEQKNLVLAQYAPSVSAQFGKNLTASNGSPESDAWDALVSVQVPIFSGGQREIDLLTAHHNIKESEISFETTKKTVESDVETTWLQTETLRETIKSLKAQVDANEQNYEDLKNQYEAGTATSLDTQTALIQLANSRTTLVTQTYEYQVALRDLERAKGDFQNKRIKGVRLP